jgi:transposase
VLAQTDMGQDPLSGNLYLFSNQDHRLLKALYWDRNGFCLWQKRLERDRFPWPRSEEAARAITVEQLRMLLAGIDFWNAHGTITYRTVV